MLSVEVMENLRFHFTMFHRTEAPNSHVLCDIMNYSMESFRISSISPKNMADLFLTDIQMRGSQELPQGANKQIVYCKQTIKISCHDWINGAM